MDQPENNDQPVAFVYDKALSSFSYGPDHPMKPARLHRTYQLLDAYGAFDWPESRLVPLAPGTEADLLTFHAPDYVAAVKALSAGEPVPDAGRFNFGPGDNPAFEGMYEAFQQQVAASLTAANRVAGGEVDRAFSIAGGLHHAGPAVASGFCVFNDVVIAIRHLLDRGLRIAYVDIDAHHGDGVQNAFYDSDRVLTISLHEGPSFLFPGTGAVDEVGRDRGRGCAINIPFPPYTNDEAYLWAFEQIVPKAIELFGPDIVVLQAGIDTHLEDPLTHLNLSTHGYVSALRKIMDLAPRLVVLGGGGYAIAVVARAWTLAYATLLGREADLPDNLPDRYAQIYGPGQLRDSQPHPLAKDTSEYVWDYVRQTVRQLQKDALPILDRAMDKVRPGERRGNREPDAE